MLGSTNRIVILAGTVVVLGIVGAVTYLTATGKLGADVATNVFMVVLGALGVGTAAHATASVVSKSGQ